MDNKLFFASFFLRVGLAVTFFYASISSYLEPSSWIGFIPPIIREIIPTNIFLNIHSAFLILLGLWMISNKKIFYAAGVSALTIFLIMIFNIGALDILFRDIAIFFSALALLVLSYEER